MMKADWVKAIDEAIEAKQRIYNMSTPDRDRFDKNVEKAMIDIRPMGEIESLQSRNQALTARVRQLESELARQQSWVEGINAECNDMMLARSALSLTASSFLLIPIKSLFTISIL